MMGLAVHRMGIGPAAVAAAPLDDYTTGLIRCYGTIQLLSSYTDPLLRVSRSSDSAEQDIGQISGLLDTSALLSFVGAGNGTVQTWYDQVGSNNATRRNNNQIVSAGVLRTGPSSGAPYINFPGPHQGATGDGFDFAALASAPYTVFGLVETTAPGMIVQRLSGGAYLGFWLNGYAQPMSNQYVDGVLQATTQTTYNAIAAAGHAVVSGAGTSIYDVIACYRAMRVIAVAVYSGILSAAQVGDISAAIKGGV